MLYTAVQTRRVFPATLPFGKQERFALSYRTLYKALASLRAKANRCEERLRRSSYEDLVFYKSLERPSSNGIGNPPVVAR
jgi:hypothetical protein